MRYGMNFIIWFSFQNSKFMTRYLFFINLAGTHLRRIPFPSIDVYPVYHSGVGCWKLLSQYHTYLEQPPMLYLYTCWKQNHTCGTTFQVTAVLAIHSSSSIERNLVDDQLVANPMVLVGDVWVYLTTRWRYRKV